MNTSIALSNADGDVAARMIASTSTYVASTLAWYDAPAKKESHMKLHPSETPNGLFEHIRAQPYLQDNISPPQQLAHLLQSDLVNKTKNQTAKLASLAAP